MIERRIKSKRYAGVYMLQQKDKDVSYSILYKNFEGKNKRETIGLKSEGVTELFAYNKRIERISKSKHGVDLRVQKRKGAVEFLEVWELYVENKALSDNIRKDYRGRWNKHMKQDFSKTVTMEKLITFRKRLENLERPLSARSIDMMIGMLGSATRYWNSRPNNHLKVYDAVSDLREYDKDHITKKEKRKRRVQRNRYLELDEIHLLKEALLYLHPEVNLFVHLALSTGARLGSIMLIQAKHISTNKVIVVDEKDGHELYTAYLDNDTQSLVNLHLINLKPNDGLFTLTKASLQKKLQRLLNKLFNQGLETTDRVNRAVIHTLRHTFASHLVSKDISLVVVQKLLNHSDLETTSRYAHLAPDAGKNAVLELWSSNQ